MGRCNPTRPRAVVAIALLSLAAGAAEGAPRWAPHGKQAARQRSDAGAPTKTRSRDVLTKEGRIMIVRGLHGGEPQLTDRRGKRWLLTGPARQELLRLGGHVVRVWGTPGPKKLMQPTLHVTRYEILDSGGGRKPLVGLLRRGPTGKLQLEQKRITLKVRASRPMLERLSRKVNCKVWIVGEVLADVVKVNKFGWLSCKRPQSIKPRKETR